MVVLLVVAVIFIYKNIRPRPKFYPGFGLSIPNGYQEVGIDVSRHQGKIFWEEVARMNDQGRHVSFVFIKATEGFNMQDRCFADNWEKSGSTKMLRGAYHFFHPNQSSKDQAENFLQNTSFIKGDLRPVLDVEVDENVSVQAIQDSVCKWLSIVGEHYHTAPIIYTSASFYNKYLKGDFDDYPLWIAHYRAPQPAIQTDFQFCQFNDCGQINGIDGDVDFNVFSGDSTALQSFRMH